MRRARFRRSSSGRTRRMMLLIKSEPSSLDDHLLNRPYPPLSWRRMLQTTIGAAPGLDFDHEGVREGFQSVQRFSGRQIPPNSRQNCNNDLLGLTRLADKLQCTPYIS
ncbi:hypothetical protein BDA96_10G238200, partial [Sorghum bicolor]